MKHPKPGFKVFLKTRIRHPLKSNEKLVFINTSGEKFIDTGSIHTYIFIFGCTLLLGLTKIILIYNTLGFILLCILTMLILRCLRYFWTDFVRLNEEGQVIDDKSLYYLKKHRKSKLVKWLTDGLNNDDVKYTRYKGWQNALILLEALSVLAVVIVIFHAAYYSPYSRFYEIDPGGRNVIDLPNFELIYSDGSVIVDPDYGKVRLEQNIETLSQAYEVSRAYINTFCPEAELNYYAKENDVGNTVYHFTFKNFQRGLLLNKAYQIMSIEINIKENWMKTDYYSYYALESRFAADKEPPQEIDTEKIISIVLQKTGLSRKNIGYCCIGSKHMLFNSSNLIDPYEGIWAVYLDVDGELVFYTVDAIEGVVAKEDFNF